MEYRHTQPGWITIAAIVAAIIVLLLSTAGRETSQLTQGIGVLLIVLVLGLFSSLTVEIRDGVLHCTLDPA